MSKLSLILPLILLFILLSFLIYILSPVNSTAQAKPFPVNLVPTFSSECSDGEIKTCNLGICSGTKKCINGKFSSCSLEIICTPGDRKSCVENACASGYKTCNECGTGYTECTKV